MATTTLSAFPLRESWRTSWGASGTLVIALNQTVSDLAGTVYPRCDNLGGSLASLGYHWSSTITVASNLASCGAISGLPKTDVATPADQARYFLYVYDSKGKLRIRLNSTGWRLDTYLGDNISFLAWQMANTQQYTSRATQIVTDANTLQALLTSSEAPTDATYITQTPSALLSAEQAMSLLGTGLVKNTTGTGVLSIATTSDFADPGSQVFNVKASPYNAVGNGTTDDTAAVLSAITAQQASGGELFFPPGSYLISGTGAQLLLFTKSVKLTGIPGWSILLVKASSSVPATTDIIKYKPGAGTYQYPTKKENRYFVMDGISVLSQTAADGPGNSTPPAGTGGRYALVLDSTNVGGYIHNFEVKNCYFGLLNGSFTVNLVSGPDANDDDLFTGTIGPNNILERGITATTLGDTVNVVGNNFRGIGYALDVTFVNGSTTFNFCNNNVISDKGLHFGGFGVMLNIEGNVFEPLYGGAGSNGACVDFDGSGGQILTARFVGNRINAEDSGANLNGVRINSASTVFVDNNDITVPVGKFAIIATASANNPVFGFNRYGGAGGAISDSSPTSVYLVRTTSVQVANFSGHMGVENLYAGTKMEVGTSEAVTGSGYKVGMFGAGSAFLTARETGSDVELNAGARTTDGWIGTATNHPLSVRTNNLDRWKFDASGNLITFTDNTLDVGASGATRPRTGYFGTSLSAPSILATTSLTVGGGTALTGAVVYTPSLTPSSVAANVSVEQDFTVTGLTTADKVTLNNPAPVAGTGIVGVRVKSANTLSITFANFTAGALTPAAGVYPLIAIRS